MAFPISVAAARAGTTCRMSSSCRPAAHRLFGRSFSTASRSTPASVGGWSRHPSAQLSIHVRRQDERQYLLLRTAHPLPPSSMLGSQPMLSRRPYSSTLIACNAKDALGSHMMRLLRPYSSAPISCEGKDAVAITQTSSSAAAESDGTATDTTETSQPLPPQKAEARILELQTHVRTHHGHAAYHEALQTSKDLLEACLALLGESHPATASAYNNIGLMHKMLGEFDDSRTNYKKALELYGEIVGTDHGSYAVALNNLGNLDRVQSTMDEELSSEERLKLNESAVKYFDDALAIRTVELGDDHPQTVTSRTNLGGALAALVLQRHAAAAKAAEKKAEGNGDGDGQDTKDDESEPSTALEDTRGWEAAEDHLRSALNTATNNPRGKKAAISAHNQAIDDAKKKKKREKPLSKRQKARAAKMEKKQRQRENVTKHIKETASVGEATAGGSRSDIQTLSAAAAAQNLAVFLKSRADVVGAAAEAGLVISPHLDRNDMYAESRRLYESALQVRSELRGKHHPDVVTTKFSLAELLATTGDEDGANALRSEILEAYDVTEKGVEEAEGKESK